MVNAVKKELQISTRSNEGGGNKGNVKRDQMEIS